ncbi:DUF1707 domain-containing protein [Streptomonospora sp. S1-112]|uniref:DUF1707 domain-containing protein n=1 Tax=Streptomonospora mangrovi TaxID=2883123 RepID=A0A9X3NP95_9ACTN|nr:DUF1707 domain-containing protein [Streptomonospora mangrovi]MDA0566978.1 DUF1707 domain-containing protein [Streptomonospora mangrovi]
MPPQQDDPSQLLSAEDREAAVRRLQAAYADERITHEEMDTRLGQVLTARTYGDLTPALAALPEEKGGELTISAAGGRIDRRGPWRVPRFLKVESAYGRVRLDLSRAVIEHPVVDIELQVPYGGARITVPRDAVVDLEGLHTAWKDVRYRPRAGTGGGPTIRITGAMGFGRLRIRHARR